MDEAFLALMAKKDFEYITVKEICVFRAFVYFSLISFASSMISKAYFCLP